jgi:hypothetical protein
MVNYNRDIEGQGTVGYSQQELPLWQTSFHLPYLSGPSTGSTLSPIQRRKMGMSSGIRTRRPMAGDVVLNEGSWENMHSGRSSRARSNNRAKKRKDGITTRCSQHLANRNTAAVQS